jgi:cell division protein FtsN
MLFGVGLGLVIALIVYIRGIAPPSAPGTPTEARQPPTQPVEPVAAEPAARAAARAQPAPGDDPTADEARFDFYEMLPQFEVVVPEVETSGGRNAPVAAVDEPGQYVLQAGSFASLGDADRMQASLALLGVESRIQRVTIDDAVYHRVRIGPLDDLSELNEIRRRLRDARIDTLLMKLQN